MKFIFSSSFALLFVSIFSGCRDNNNQLYIIQGFTQGTTYRINYMSQNALVNQASIDSLLTAFSQLFSTYDKSSFISQLNQIYKTDTFILADKNFYHLFAASMAIHKLTEGSFDPGLLPVVNFWHHKNNVLQHEDSLIIDSLITFSSIKNWVIKDSASIYFIQKKHPYAALDFNAIAQGFSVDWVCNYLEALSIENYMVEVGGEVKCNGKNQKGIYWQIGIDLPENSDAETRKLKAIVSLENSALATSGNYRNFKLLDGKKYGHTIDPATGYPSLNSTLSVSVLAETAMEADAYATAFMVWGWEKSLAYVEKNVALEAYYIYADSNHQLQTIYSSGLKNKIKEL